MPRQWFRFAVMNFFIAATLGLILRYAFVEELGWLDYRHMMHAHSHVAMLGWLHLGVYALLIYYFLPEKLHSVLVYRQLFWGQQLCVVGMLIFFPVYGYAAWSIVFTTLHLLLSYIFVWRFNRDLGRYSQAGKFSRRFARFALLWLVLSTLALWAMIPVMALKMQQSAFYYASIQFYLHFQFNGWFIWAALALALRLTEQKGIIIPTLLLNKFFYLLGLSCLLTYVLAVTWSNPIPFLFWINSAGVGLQLLALYFFLKAILPAYRQLKIQLNRWTNSLLQISFLCFVAKILIQTVVIIPYLATVAYTIRNYVLGFLHLILLGVMSCGLFALSSERGWMNTAIPAVRAGLVLFLCGFVLTELFLFLQGTFLWAAWGFIPYYYEGIFGLSVLMPVGLAFIMWNWLATKPKKQVY